MKLLIRLVLVFASLIVAILLYVGYVFRDRRQPIYFAVERGDTNYISSYLASGSNVNANINCYPLAENYRCAPMLDVALENGQIETVEFLLKRGANPNQPDSRGQTPLMWVIGLGGEKRLRMLRMLLDAGADAKAPAHSEYRYTPLIEAASFGETEVARVLIDAGAEINGTNKIGQTALHLVGRHVECAELLIAAGADVSAKDAHGQTPVDYAIRDRCTDTLAILTNALRDRQHMR